MSSYFKSLNVLQYKRQQSPVNASLVGNIFFKTAIYISSNFYLIKNYKFNEFFIYAKYLLSAGQNQHKV